MEGHWALSVPQSPELIPVPPSARDEHHLSPVSKVSQKTFQDTPDGSLKLYTQVLGYKEKASISLDSPTMFQILQFSIYMILIQLNTTSMLRRPSMLSRTV